jgi:PAS domain S-box-containing protein
MTRTLRVLNLEDNPDDSVLLQRFLRKQGLTLTFLAVTNEACFRAALADGEWDVILADYTVPGFEAPSALEVLRQSGRDIPFIVLSGAVGEDVLVNIMRAGAADFILKDRMARLVPAIERELQEASNRRERTREQTARLQSEARLRAILDNSPAAIYMKNSNGRYMLANRVCTEIFGSPDSEIVGKTDFDVYPEALAQQFSESDKRVIREGQPIQFEERPGICKNKVYLSVKFPVYDIDSSVLGVGGIATDITGLKQAEEALRRSEKLAAAGRLAATIAHEINNPLEAVTNLLYLLAHHETLPSGAQQLLQLADRELSRVSHIARQTLGFYKESARATTFAVSEAAQQIIDLMQWNFQKKGIQLVTELHTDAVLFGLRGEIVQLFSNLLANAVDACRAGGTIHVRVRRVGPTENGRRSSQQVLITVADNGTGIPTSSIAEIYEPFYTTKRDVGTGLGLWVTKNIVENHRGNIRLRSRFGFGTVFRITLSAAQQTDLAIAASDRS